MPDGRARPSRARSGAASRPASCATARSYIKSDAGGARPTERIASRRLKELLADYNSVGITSIVDANADRGGSSSIARCCDRSALTCRTFIAYGVDAQAPLDKIEARSARPRRTRCTSTTTCCGCAASRPFSTAAC